MASSNNPRPTSRLGARVHQVRYRVWQLWRAVSGPVTAADQRFAQSILTPAEYNLFCRMPRYDQRHTLDVAALLYAEGVRDEALLALALLHDTGKVSDDGRPLGLIWYGVGVVLRRFPAVLQAAQSQFEPLRRAAAHEARSVAAATAVGARPAVIGLLTALAAGSDDPLLRLFREADDRC